MTAPFVYNELQYRVWRLWQHDCDLTSKYAEVTFTKQTGLSHQQYLILLAMEFMNDPVTATDLAHRVERNTNTVSMILDRMETSGLVKKVRDLPDRRLVRLAMTKKGKEKLRESTKVGWGLMGRLMSSFSEEELHTFAGLLEKLRERAFEELHPGKAIEKAQIEDFQKIVRLLKKAGC